MKKVVLVVILLILTTSLFAKNTQSKQLKENETMFIINSTDYKNAKTQLTNKCKKLNRLIKEAM